MLLCTIGIKSDTRSRAGHGITTREQCQQEIMQRFHIQIFGCKNILQVLIKPPTPLPAFFAHSVFIVRHVCTHCVAQPCFCKNVETTSSSLVPTPPRPPTALSTAAAFNRRQETISSSGSYAGNCCNGQKRCHFLPDNTKTNDILCYLENSVNTFSVHNCNNIYDFTQLYFSVGVNSSVRRPADARFSSTQTAKRTARWKPTDHNLAGLVFNDWLD